MKLIDLVNMAAKGEQLPYAIRIKKSNIEAGCIEYHYDGDVKDYRDITEAPMIWNRLFLNYGILDDHALNTECEVISETRYG